ncbi:hypothetical protein MBLNU230_g5149t1 [Neophaeotheca triangularis]
MRSSFAALSAIAALIPSTTCAAVHKSHGNDSSLLPYQDATLCIDDRVDDLMSRMDIQDKAGQLFHSRTTIDDEDLNSTIADKKITAYVFSGGVNDARAVAEWHNQVQEFARSTGLGIPITLSSDPQHGSSENLGVNTVGQAFSRWPEPMGIAALRDPKLMRTFAEIAREEYRAVGLAQALHPQIDLPTEPRWGRAGFSFSEDANLTVSMLVEYIKGFQGEDIDHHSVIITAKHFPGGATQKNGEDSHFPWGQEQVYPGNMEDYHLIPFEAAIAADVRQVMPYYSKPEGNGWEEVAFAFNKDLITGLLKEKMGFDGIVVTDWGIVSTRGWGLLEETDLERTRRAIEAGCDIFGGEELPELIIELVNEGIIPESRIDYSVRKLMKEKFELGLFDEARFVDPDVAERLVGNEYWNRLGEDVQRRSFTLLTNKDDFLPLSLPSSASFYIEGINETICESRGLNMAATPDEADYALLRYVSPSRPTIPFGLEASINNGSIEFNATEQARQAEIYAKVPTVVDITFNRFAAVPEVAEQAAALFGSYGSSDETFLDIVFGVNGARPEGRLPFDMPISDQAAADAKEDVPFDSEALFTFGHGLSYAAACKHHD